MAEYGEWNRKGASLSHVTAGKEYGVDEEFIIKGINAGKLEYRDGVMYDGVYIKVLRRQLEDYITQELGESYLRKWQERTELRAIKRELRALHKRLAELEARKSALVDSLGL